MTETKEEEYTLVFTEKELKNPNIKKAMVDLVRLKASLYAAYPFFEVSEAEVKALSRVPLFTDIKEYGGVGKFDGELGKYRSQRVVLKK